MILCVLVKGHPLCVLDGAAPPAFAGKHGDGEMIAHDGVPPNIFSNKRFVKSIISSGKAVNMVVF